MDLMVFENNKPLIIDEFREGRFDYVELASDVAEPKFFQFLFSRQVVDKLAAHYPSPRQREHVPMWMYLSSQFSLRLHGMHSFHAYSSPTARTCSCPTTRTTRARCGCCSTSTTIPSARNSNSR